MDGVFRGAAEEQPEENTVLPNFFSSYLHSISNRFLLSKIEEKNTQKDSSKKPKKRALKYHIVFLRLPGILSEHKWCMSIFYMTKLKRVISFKPLAFDLVSKLRARPLYQLSPKLP